MFIMPLFLLISWWVSGGYSADTNLHLLSGGSGGGGGGDTMSCMHKLVPCKPYLTEESPLPSPPEGCCVALKEMLENESGCLCEFLGNVDLLKKLNLTQDHALKLPKDCDANVDISLCSKKGSEATTSGNPSNATAPTTPSNSELTNTTTTATSSSGWIPDFGDAVLLLIAELFLMEFYF